MSIGTWTWQNKNLNLGFPLINLNFQSLENRRTCQHKHKVMHTLGVASPGEQRGAAQGQAALIQPTQLMIVPCQMGISEPALGGLGS